MVYILNRQKYYNFKAGSVAQVVPTTDGLTSYTQGQQHATSWPVEKIHHT